jgi:hypothetical protein
MATQPNLNDDNTLSSRGVIAVCEREGDSVQVGFEGGVPALCNAARRKGMAEARELWKLRYPRSNQGIIIKRNWIDGTAFLTIADELRAR